MAALVCPSAGGELLWFGIGAGFLQQRLLFEGMPVNRHSQIYDIINELKSIKKFCLTEE